MRLKLQLKLKHLLLKLLLHAAAALLFN